MGQLGAWFLLLVAGAVLGQRGGGRARGRGGGQLGEACEGLFINHELSNLALQQFYLYQLDIIQKMTCIMNSPQTPHNVAGSCVALRQCGPVLQLLQSGLSRDKVSYVRRSVCRIKGKLRNRRVSDV